MSPTKGSKFCTPNKPADEIITRIIPINGDNNSTFKSFLIKLKKVIKK